MNPNLIVEYWTKLVKYVPKNIGAVVGMLQTAVSFVRELCMLVARMICPIWPGDADEKVVAKIKNIAETILGILEKFKNWLLMLGFKE